MTLGQTPPDFGIWVAGYLFGFPVVTWLVALPASKLEKFGENPEELIHFSVLLKTEEKTIRLILPVRSQDNKFMLPANITIAPAELL